MHELSLAAEIVDLIRPKVPPEEKLSKVFVTVGPLSGVWPDALEFGFEEIARQNGFADAKMVITRTHARAACDDCGAEYAFDPPESRPSCPRCGSSNRRVMSGNEFTVDSIEVED